MSSNVLSLLRFFLLAISLGVACPSLSRAWSPEAPRAMEGTETGYVTSPSVAIDELGYAHVVWAQGNDLRYARGRFSEDGNALTFEPPTGPAPGFVVNAQNPPRIALSANAPSTVHVAFGCKDEKIYYVANAARGASGSWSTPEAVVPSTTDDYDLDLAVDDDNVPYVAFGDGLGNDRARLLLTYRTEARWATAKNIAGNTKHYLIRRVALRVLGAGDAATVHAMAEVKETETSAGFYVGYARGARASAEPAFAYRNFSAERGAVRNGDGDSPALATEPGSNKLYAAFIDGTLDPPLSSYRLAPFVSTDGGNTWTALPKITHDSVADSGPGVNKVWAGTSSLVARAGVLHVVSEQKEIVGADSYQNIHIDYQTLTVSNGAISPPQRLSDSQWSTRPFLAIGGRGKAAVWMASRDKTFLAYDHDPGGDTLPPTSTSGDAGQLSFDGGDVPAFGGTGRSRGGVTSGCDVGASDAGGRGRSASLAAVLVVLLLRQRRTRSQR